MTLRWMLRNTFDDKSNWFRYWLGVIRQQAITSVNVDPELYSHMPSLGHNDLMIWLLQLKLQSIQCMVEYIFENNGRKLLWNRPLAVVLQTKFWLNFKFRKHSFVYISFYITLITTKYCHLPRQHICLGMCTFYLWLDQSSLNFSVTIINKIRMQSKTLWHRVSCFNYLACK